MTKMFSCLSAVGHVKPSDSLLDYKIDWCSLAVCCDVKSDSFDERPTIYVVYFLIYLFLYRMCVCVCVCVCVCLDALGGGFCRLAVLVEGGAARVRQAARGAVEQGTTQRRVLHIARCRHFDRHHRAGERERELTVCARAKLIS